MPRERAFWMVLGSLVLIGLAAGLFSRRGGDRQLALVETSPLPVGQEMQARIWREVRFVELWRIAVGPAMEQPTLLRTDSSGNLYVLDSGQPQVLKLSAQNRLLARFAHPSMGNPTDVAVGGQGEVWVCDPDRNAIAVFGPDGAFLRKIAPRPPAVRLALDSRGGFVATGVTGGEGLFRRYSPTGELEKSFGVLFERDLQSSLAADGWIVSNGPFLVYPFRNAGLLASYTTDGTLRFLRKTITSVPLPKVHVDAAGRPSLDRETPLASISGSIVGDDLYILSEAAPGHRVLDVYETERGSYRYSLHPPEGDARYVVLMRDRLYSASRRGVTAWSLAEPTGQPAADSASGPEGPRGPAQ